MFATDYRPKTFSEVEGQDLAKETLKSIALSDGIKVRSILLQGAWGSGKCIPGHVRVVTSHGYVPIQSLYPNPKEGFNSFIEPVNTRKGKQLCTHFYYQRQARVKSLYLSNGAVIEGTDKHRILAHVNKMTDLVPMSLIQEGDEVLFPEIPQEYGVDDDRAFLLGVLVSRAKVKGNRIRVACAGDLAVVLQRTGKWHKESFRIVSAELSEFKDYMDLEINRQEYYLPSWAFNLSVKSRVDFLRGILYAIGSIKTDKVHPSVLPLRVKSSRLAKDIMQVIETLGITPICKDLEEGGKYLTFPLSSLALVPEYRALALKKSNLVKILYNVSDDEIKEMMVLRKQKCSSNIKLLRTLHNISIHGRAARFTLQYIKDCIGKLPFNLDMLLTNRALTVVRVSYHYKDVFDLTVPCVEEFYAQGTYNHNTTLARIFAKAVNCPSLKTTGDVCNQCENCKDADRSNSQLYREYDATRVGNVDSIKTLLDSLQIKNFEGRRVVCIDEVHTASRQAQSALLKVLEDGVPDTIFVFCCTEEVIKTIKSRSVFLEVSTLSVEQIMRRCKIVASQEGFDITDSQLEQVALKSQGHMRDALSILEHYSIAGELALKTSIADFRKFILLLLQKKECEDVLRQLLQYPLHDIQASIRYFLTTCFTAKTGFEAKVRQTGLALKLFKFFYSPESQQAFKDEAGMEILLRALIESLR